MREFALGARLTLAGGRSGLLRTAVTAIGVALGVAVLLVAASIPSLHDGRQARGQARGDLGFGQTPPAGGASVLVASADTRFRARDIRARLLQGSGAGAPVPPGIPRLPAAGEVFVSPALARLLATSDGSTLLAPRIPGRIMGTIAADGLLGPADLMYYAGARDLVEAGTVRRVYAFGSTGPPERLNPILELLVVIALVAVLLPVAVLVGAAVRTGGEERDRRLAALRLIGADQRMARRIAAGEALVSAVAGLVLGALAFLVVRQFADHISIWDTSFYRRDVRPSPWLAAVVVLGVPAAAVLVSLLALRRVVAEPLGVVRRAEAAGRRRVWWRLLLPALGLLALASAARGQSADLVSPVRVGVGVIALLIGVAALLPWVVERVVARLGAGKVAWQLAVRRLQLDPGGPARAVSGITVAVAGAIALQMVFTGTQDEFRHSTGADPNRATLTVRLEQAGAPAAITAGTLTERMRAVPGVRTVTAVSEYAAGRDPDASDGSLIVGSCTALREVVGTRECRDGDVFFAQEPRRETLAFGASTWTVPAGARDVPTRIDPAGVERGGIFATPGAVRALALPAPYISAYLRTDPAVPDAEEGVRNVIGALDPRADIQETHRTRTDGEFSQVRRAMLIGASIVVALIGLSLLLTTLEQLRERRKLLAVLVAFGTRRSTLGWSVFWQAALPVALGIGIAIVTGLVLGAVLLRILGDPVAVAWVDVAAMAGVGVLVVLAVTAASLPVLWRTMRPEGLRTE